MPVFLRLLRQIVRHNHGNGRVIMPVIEDAVLVTRCYLDFDIGLFKYSSSHFSTTKHIYNESVDSIEICDIIFDGNDWFYLP